MVEIECPKCGRRWDYTGKNQYTATCPDCRKIVKIEENKVEDEIDEIEIEPIEEGE